MNLIAEDNPQFGHISYKEGQVKVINASNEVTGGVVNLPLAAGDKIVTGPSDRCEIQYDNGTILRLGHDGIFHTEHLGNFQGTPFKLF